MIPQDYTYLKPSRRSLSGVYLPSIAKDKYLEALVAVDTSGSISGQELNQFLSEIQWIARNFPIRITLLSVDADIHDKIELRCFADVRKITGLRGGGGTDFRAVFDYAVKHRKRLIIFFTDGFGTFPEKTDIKTIWVVSPNGAPSKNFPFGKVIRISATQR
jgi:predicted metal-dependent peptidase